MTNDTNEALTQKLMGEIERLERERPLGYALQVKEYRRALRILNSE
jgi:hypothetical protein